MAANPRHEWRERSNLLFHTSVVTCSLCGKMIPTRYWVVSQDDGFERIFCDADCERLYNEYWLPKYGTGERPS
jgi:hypothetical protein